MIYIESILWHINIIFSYNYLSSSATCFNSEFISSFWELNVSFVLKRFSSCAFRELSSLLILSLRALFSSVKVLYFSRTVTNSVAAAASMISLALCSCLDSCKDYYFRNKLDFVADSMTPLSESKMNKNLKIEYISLPSLFYFYHPHHFSIYP